MFDPKISTVFRKFAFIPNKLKIASPNLYYVNYNFLKILKKSMEKYLKNILLNIKDAPIQSPLINLI